MFQKARRRWRNKESYVVETTFSNVCFSPFLHPLYLLWVTAFSLKLLGEGGSCVLPLFFLILYADV